MKRIVIFTVALATTPEVAQKWRTSMQEKLGDEYVVFVIQGIEGQHTKFEIFTDEKIEPIELDALKIKVGVE